MSAYDVLWGVAEGNYGIITSAKAKGLGVSRKLSDSGRRKKWQRESRRKRKG